jgi:hypothetical protein
LSSSPAVLEYVFDILNINKTYFPHSKKTKSQKTGSVCKFMYKYLYEEEIINTEMENRSTFTENSLVK